MTLELPAESKSFMRTLEDLTDEAEMANGELLREKVDSLYLKRSIDPDDAIRIEKILKERGFSIQEAAIRQETDTALQNATIHSSAVDHLISDAKRVKLLTPEQEAELGDTIQRAEAILQKTTTERTEIEIRVIDAGKRAIDVLVRHNIRLVTSFVYDPRYRNKHDIDDMVQMGLIGLIRAAERFNPALGCRFSTYAMWWIRQGVHRGISNDGRTIRLPVHMIERVGKFRRASQALGLIADSAKITIHRVAESLGWTPEFTARVAQISQMHIVSFEMPVGAGDGMTLGEIIPDRLPDPEGRLNTNEIKQHIQEMLLELEDERQIDIIRRRYGLGVPEETLESIGEGYKITRERVRQIEAKALKRLLRWARRRKLKGVLYD